MLNALFALTCTLSGAQGPAVELIPLANPPAIGKTSAQQELHLGGFSGLLFLKKEGDELFFVTHTDRGPNPKKINGQRPFALPEFAPELVFFSVTKGQWSISKRLPLKLNKDKTITGLPNKEGNEIPVTLTKKALAYDGNGLDLEALALDPANGYWMGDEYGPSLLHFDKDGHLVKRLLPGKELPAVYAKRKHNRGFEGIAVQDGKVYGFLQSPLAQDGLKGRIVEVDLKSLKTTGEYFYPFESKKSDKIGDVWGLGKGEFLVLEQNDDLGKKSIKKIFKIVLNGSNKEVKKTLITDLSATPLRQFEKVEGLTVIDKNILAVITDNDFTIKGSPDVKTGKIPLKEEQSQLGIIKY
ncbi:hypothetical protein D3C87_162660 [compost metagenome]